MDGLSVLKKIREHDKSLPVLLLTARDRIEDKVEGLDRGADDYLTKPFELPELVARLRVVSRRLSARADSRIQVNGVTLDPAANTISVGDRRIDVSGKEYSVLLTLMENKGRLLSREKMEAKLYAWGEELSSNAVEVHIHNLRKKLGKDFIKTVRGCRLWSRPRVTSIRAFLILVILAALVIVIFTATFPRLSVWQR